MTSDLMDAVLKEMDRVWGDEGFGGEGQEYEWLLANYGISEEDDLKWQWLLLDSTDELPEEDADDPEVIEFLDNENAVRAFLSELLARYKSSSAVYPRG